MPYLYLVSRSQTLAGRGLPTRETTTYCMMTTSEVIVLTFTFQNCSFVVS